MLPGEVTGNPNQFSTVGATSSTDHTEVNGATGVTVPRLYAVTPEYTAPIVDDGDAVEEDKADCGDGAAAAANAAVDVDATGTAP